MFGSISTSQTEACSKKLRKEFVHAGLSPRYCSPSEGVVLEQQGNPFVFDAL